MDPQKHPRGVHRGGTYGKAAACESRREPQEKPDLLNFDVGFLASETVRKYAVAVSAPRKRYFIMATWAEQ